MLFITKKSQPYLNINKDGIVVYKANETLKSKKIELTWDKIDFIDIKMVPLQRAYTIVLEIQTKVDKEDTELKQSWFLTSFDEMQNKHVYFTTDLLHLDQSWEEIIISLQSYNEKFKFNANRITKIYDSIDTIKKGQSIWMLLLSLLLLGLSVALYNEKGFTNMHIIFAILSVFTITNAMDYRVVRRYGSNDKN